MVAIEDKTRLLKHANRHVQINRDIVIEQNFAEWLDTVVSIMV